MKVGDTVRIVRMGWVYSTYTKFVESAAPTYAHLFTDPGLDYIDSKGLFTIVAIAPHLRFTEDVIVVILSANQHHVYAFKIDGLEVVDAIDSHKLLNVGGF